MQTFVGVLIQTGVTVIAGLLFYFIASLLLHFPEVEVLKQFFSLKFLKRKIK